MTPAAGPSLTVTVFDYGAGNLHSLAKALEAGGATVRVAVDPTQAVVDTDALVLPGVGAFAPAAAALAAGRGRDAMRAALRDGLPTLGICLGMQLLFDGSDEGPGEGLGIVPGRVTRLRATRVPQIGWNALVDGDEPLLRDAGLAIAYYANSFVGRPTAAGERFVTAWSDHEGDRFPAVVRVGRVVGTQFHPEKSSGPGVAFLRQFLGMASARRSGA